MLTLSIILLSLLSTALAFSLIELGLMAYAVWNFSQNYEFSYFCGFDVCYKDAKGTVPDVAAFLMFCAVWSTLASAAAIGGPLFFHSRNGHHHNSWLAPGLIVLYFLTWLFWLAGFADLANIIGTYGTSIMNAVLAFAILSWLVYTALFILSFLAIFDVMEGEWPGYLTMKPRSANVAPAVSSTPATTGAPEEPKYETGHELTA